MFKVGDDLCMFMYKYLYIQYSLPRFPNLLKMDFVFMCVLGSLKAQSFFFLFPLKVAQLNFLLALGMDGL